MQLGEVVFGGVGCGLYGMLIFVIVAVFLAGLMVGRTPEYLGKKIRPYEMKMAALCSLGSTAGRSHWHHHRRPGSGEHGRRPQRRAPRLKQDRAK